MIRWLESEAHGKKALMWILICVVAGYTYSLLTVTLMRKFDMPLSRSHDEGIPIVSVFSFFPLVCGCTIEEVLYRLPLALLLLLRLHILRFDQRPINTWPFIFLAVAILSVGFGYAHGGVDHIFVQGVTGFCFSLLFIKCGGNNGRFVKALACTIIAHFLFNEIEYARLSLKGITEF